MKWQSMDTAPKDGEGFDVQITRYARAYWDEHLRRFVLASPLVIDTLTAAATNALWRREFDETGEANS